MLKLEVIKEKKEVHIEKHTMPLRLEYYKDNIINYDCDLYSDNLEDITI